MYNTRARARTHTHTRTHSFSFIYMYTAIRSPITSKVQSIEQFFAGRFRCSRAIITHFFIFPFYFSTKVYTWDEYDSFRIMYGSSMWFRVVYNLI